nr:Na+/H+ antiporter NhaC family protein [Treponema sp.]
HVSTQLPYAITVAAVSFLAYIVAGLTQNLNIVVSGIISWIVAIAALFGVLIFMKKKVSKDNK